jgi:tetratricopeptide (TPR) repeat protein
MIKFMKKCFLNSPGILVLLALLVLICPGWVEADDFARGVKALDMGQDEQAVGLFSSYLSRKPRTYEALLNRGTAFARNRRICRAITDWSAATEVAPLFAYSLYIDDVIRIVAPKNSLLKYVANIELYPERAASVVMAGATLLDLGHRSAAVDLFRRSTLLTKNPLFKTDLEYWIKTLDPSHKAAEQK